ncbi:MAG TPA: GIY-YIG nuclease family protein [Patescibacteria group bacterium]
MFYTYILFNESSKKTYVGHTDNKKRRLAEHNSAKGLYSRRYMPWKIIYSEEFATLEESVKREKYFKSAAGRRWMKKNLFNNK